MKVSNIKQWKTSLIGIVIMIVAITSVFFGKTWVDASIGISIGTLFLFAPDKIIDNAIKYINK
jgi:Co/Zn/Cd efflux system component